MQAEGMRCNPARRRRTRTLLPRPSEARSPSMSRGKPRSTATVALPNSIRHHVQESFGGLQDVRYDSEPPLLNPAPEATLAPLRTSDRKKLRQRLIQEFSLSPEIGELLVPEGLLSVKYTSHSRVPGVRHSEAISWILFFFYSIASRWFTFHRMAFRSGSRRGKGLIN